MTLEGKCHNCGEWFDAHWLTYSSPVQAVVAPTCHNCGSEDVEVFSDEDLIEIEEGEN